MSNDDTLLPDAPAIRSSLEGAIQKGEIKLPLMQLTAQEVCEKPAIKEQHLSIWTITNNWQEAIDLEVQYIHAKAIALIYDGKSRKPYGEKTTADELLGKCEHSLADYYKYVGMAEGEKSLEQQFRTLDRIASQFVEHDLGIKVKAI